MRRNGFSQLTRFGLLLFAFILSPVFCGVSHALSPGAPEPPAGAQLDKIFREFEATVERARVDFGVPGMAVAVVQGDKMIYSRGFGVRELGRPEPVDPHTLFQIGSTSKAFTSALVASVVDEGKLGWNDRVTGVLPGFAMADPWVTKEFQVRDLMAQHSGMKAYTGDFLAMIGYDREDIVRSTAHIAPVYSFRSDFSYVNNLWVTAAAVVEAKTGKTWEQDLQERLLDPLGMTETSYTQAALQGSPDGATPHLLEKGKVKPTPRDWPYFNWPYVYGPAGGINSNVLDMAKWIRFQLGDGTFEGKKILGKEALEYPHQPQTPIKGGKNAYCMGWLKSDYRPYPLIWHNGATSGCATLVMLVPDLDLGIVILSNLVTPAPDNLGLAFVDLYCGTKSPDDHMGKALQSWKKKLEDEKTVSPRPKLATPPLPNSAYVGTYESPLMGTALVLERQGRLFFRVGPKSFEFVLNPLNRDNFLLEAGQFGDEAGRVRFDVGTGGKAVAFDLQDDDGDLFSQFTRTGEK